MYDVEGDVFKLKNAWIFWGKKATWKWFWDFSAPGTWMPSILNYFQLWMACLS